MARDVARAATPPIADHPRVADLRRRLIALAREGHRAPIGADLVLAEHTDRERLLHDGAALGRVMIEAADRYDTPLALSLMDLRLEKRDLLRRLGLGDTDVDTYHLTQPPDEAMMAAAQRSDEAPFDPRARAHLDAIACAAQQPGRIVCGMAIGPFSLMTKLLADPITAVALAGMGRRAEDEPDVALAERALELARGAVRRSIAAQADAGAAAVCVCEPAANTTFISPRMIADGSDVFDRFVMQPNREVAAQLHHAGVGLIFHDCGELTDGMVRAFADDLHPAMLSLGSSRVLWRDAVLTPDDVVLYGNLPTKRFYCDTELSVDAVEAMTCELISKMRPTGKPFILGSECDVLSVPGRHELITRKVERMLRCSCA